MISLGVLPSGDALALGFVPEGLERLHRRIHQFVVDGQHAGVSLLLVRNGVVADSFAAGFRNCELGLPMQRDTIVRIYSMTKIVVSVAALTLLEEGKMGLLDPVADYIPEFRDPKVVVGGTARTPQTVPADKPITIQHLFTHTSGIIYEAPGEPIDEIYRQMTDSDSLEDRVPTGAAPIEVPPGDAIRIRLLYGRSRTRPRNREWPTARRSFEHPRSGTVGNGGHDILGSGCSKGSPREGVSTCRQRGIEIGATSSRRNC